MRQEDQTSISESASHGRDNADFVTGRELCLQSVAIAYIVTIDEDIDEAANLAGIVPDPPPDPWMRRFQGVERLADTGS